MAQDKRAEFRLPLSPYHRCISKSGDKPWWFPSVTKNSNDYDIVCRYNSTKNFKMEWLLEVAMYTGEYEQCVRLVFVIIDG